MAQIRRKSQDAKGNAMKLTCLLFGVVLGATLLGCGGADLGCSNDSYVPECVNSYQRYICTHGEKAIEECITCYSCVDKGDKGARCVADSSSDE